MPRPMLALLLVLLLAPSALAHFVLLIPARPWAAKGEEFLLELSRGHPFEVERAALARPSLQVYAPDGAVQDLSGGLEAVGSEEERGWRARFTPSQRGDHVVLLETGASKHGNEAQADFVKAIVHVGGVQRGWDRVLGAPVELVPLTRPYGIPVGATFRAEVLAGGKPLGGALVEIERKNDAPPGELPPEPFITRVEKTNARGELAVTLDAPGWWILAASTPAGQQAEGAPPLVQRGSLWVYVGQ